MLHPGVGGDDEIAGEPGAEKHHQRRKPVGARADAPFTEEKKAEERGLEKKGEDAFHGQRLADYAAGGFGELRPVGAELKFHGDAGDHAEGKTDAENLGPKPRRLIPYFVSAAERDSLEDENQEGQPHSELRKNVMERNGECEMQAVNGQCVFHGPPSGTTE